MNFEYYDKVKAQIRQINRGIQELEWTWPEDERRTRVKDMVASIHQLDGLFYELKHELDYLRLKLSVEDFRVHVKLLQKNINETIENMRGRMSYKAIIDEIRRDAPQVMKYVEEEVPARILALSDGDSTHYIPDEKFIRVFADLFFSSNLEMCDTEPEKITKEALIISYVGELYMGYDSFTKKAIELDGICRADAAPEPETEEPIDEGKVPTITKTQHRIVLLKKLGILDHLSRLTVKNKQQFGYLVSGILGITDESEVGTVLRSLTYVEIPKGKEGTIQKDTALNKIDRELMKVGLSLERIEQTLKKK